MLLGHLADRLELGGHGAHHESLPVFHLRMVLMCRSTIDTALQMTYIRSTAVQFIWDQWVSLCLLVGAMTSMA